MKRFVLDTMRLLLSEQGCSGYSDQQLCLFMRLECAKHKHRLESALLALASAARALESRAVQKANMGDVKTLTVQVAGSKTSAALMAIAQSWRDEVVSTQDKFKPAFRVVKMVEPCYQLNNALRRCGCPPIAIADNRILTQKVCVCDGCCPC